MSKNQVPEKLPMTEDYLKKMDAYWRAANYLAAAQLYMLDNPLLREPLTRDQIKKKIVGHWDTRSRAELRLCTPEQSHQKV